MFDFVLLHILLVYVFFLKCVRLFVSGTVACVLVSVGAARVTGVVSVLCTVVVLVVIIIFIIIITYFCRVSISSTLVCVVFVPLFFTHAFSLLDPFAFAMVPFLSSFMLFSSYCLSSLFDFPLFIDVLVCHAFTQSIPRSSFLPLFLLSSIYFSLIVFLYTPPLLDVFVMYSSAPYSLPPSSLDFHSHHFSSYAEI